MGFAEIKNENGVTSITCYRGMGGIKSIVIHRDGTEFFCSMDEVKFSIIPKDRVVEVFEKDTRKSRKFFKEFLTFKK